MSGPADRSETLAQPFGDSTHEPARFRAPAGYRPGRPRALPPPPGMPPGDAATARSAVRPARPPAAARRASAAAACRPSESARRPSACRAGRDGAGRGRGPASGGYGCWRTAGGGQILSAVEDLHHQQEQEEPRRDGLDQRIAEGDRLAAVAATAPQPEPGQHGDIVIGADGMLAARAVRAGPGDVHARRQAIDDDVQETAHGPAQRRGTRRRRSSVPVRRRAVPWVSLSRMPAFFFVRPLRSLVGRWASSPRAT